MIIAFDGHILEDNFKTGIAWYCHRLINALAAHAPDVTCTVLFNSFRGSQPRLFTPRHPNIKLSLHRVPVGFTRAFQGRLWYDLFLPRTLKTAGCDIFHGLNFELPPPGPYRSVVTIHDLAGLVNPEFMTRGGDSWYRNWTALSLRRAGRVIVPSHYVRRCVEQYFPQQAHKVRVVHHGVDPREFHPATDRERLREFRKRHNLPDNYILFVGSIDKRKNPAALVRAYARLAQDRRTDLQLVLAGSIGRDLSVLELIGRLKIGDRVQYCGYLPQEDLVYLYAGARVFVFPSLHEGFGFPVLEAMACGVPVIASDSTSLPEISGDAALLVDPNDENRLAEAIEAVVLDPVRAGAMRERGLRQARKFTWEKTAARTIGIYQESDRPVQKERTAVLSAAAV